MLDEASVVAAVSAAVRKHTRHQRERRMTSRSLRRSRLAEQLVDVCLN